MDLGFDVMAFCFSMKIQVFVVVRLLESISYVPDGVVEANAPSLKEHYDTIMSNPKVSITTRFNHEESIRIRCGAVPIQLEWIPMFGCSKCNCCFKCLYGVEFPWLCRVLLIR